YNINGQKVATLVNRQMNPGSYSATFNAGNLSSGVYFYKLRTAEFISVKKMILTR
ncbi:MAG: peptidase S8, partial [Candidatus Neomarinimicrobiota bacterium]